MCPVSSSSFPGVVKKISSQHTNSPVATEKFVLFEVSQIAWTFFFFLNLKICIGLNFGLAAVDWPWLNGTIAVHGSGTVILAMYTFIVGPWLPTSSAIFVGLIHKLNHLMHLLQLCLLLHSNKLQICPLFPGSCELMHPSVYSRCVHICQRNHWPGTGHPD